jgi:Nickel responsive protein SCO4226-like
VTERSAMSSLSVAATTPICALRRRSTAEAMAHGGTPIRYLRSIMVPGDEAAFCVFDAPSMDVVEQLYARAGVSFDRIVDALEI